MLSLLPVGLFLFIFITNPGYMEPLLGSAIGVAVLIGGVVFIGIGIFWMQKIVKVDA